MRAIHLRSIRSLAAGVTLLAVTAPLHAKRVDAESMVGLLFESALERQETFDRIAKKWHPGYAAMLVEVLYFARDVELRQQVIKALHGASGKRFGPDVQRWYTWLWSEPSGDHPQYAEFKRRLYRQIDVRFDAYFDNDRASTIRLDEVRWGGVHQDGIPPLRGPKMIAAREADYLADDNIVFGLEVNGDVRAYPKRILAWHEMFTDTVGGLEVAGVYCTLCGTVILYETTLGDTRHRLGTSGFLYRSNKLMYDQATQSLWNTIWGRPVIGPLVGKGIELPRRSVVTTTWGEWRRRHPDTQVLSLDTGHRRDYGEGVAYREYFATDELMFNVPKLDRRLANKAEVLTFVADDGSSQTLAIAADFLKKNPIHHDRIGGTASDDSSGTAFVVLTDRSGANRAYASGDVRFASWDQDRLATDESGQRWRLTEQALIAKDGRRLPRLPATRAFWFGWYAAYPDTRLVR